MKAIVGDRYGPPDILRFTDTAVPSVGDDEALVRVRASSVNAADWHLLRGDPYVARLSFGLRAPKDAILGCDLAGRVEIAGRKVTTLRPGDEVFGSTFMRGQGAFAELASVPAEVLAAKPPSLPFDQAASVPLAGLTALQALRDFGRVEAGQRVLIIGAAGGVGTFAVQIASSFGAEVTGVCSSRNLDLVRSIGADHVIDYNRDDPLGGDRSYDLIVQLAGTRSPRDCRRALVGSGTLVLSSGESDGRWIGPMVRPLQAMLVSPFVSQRLVSFTVKPNSADLEALRELIERGEVTPVLDRTFSLDAVAEAIAYLEQGHARGKVVITV
jgi:NADPH:quinone reductase-like Zn-dependent oxidoreductase